MTTESGEVASFAIDSTSGALRALSRQKTHGGEPCHLVVDRAGKHVLVANYSGGSASVLPVGADGRLGRATAFVQQGLGQYREAIYIIAVVLVLSLICPILARTRPRRRTPAEVREIRAA